MITFDNTAIFGTNSSLFSFRLFEKGCLELVCVSCEQKNTLIEKFLSGEFSRRGCVYVGSKKLNRWNRKKYQKNRAYFAFDKGNFPSDKSIKNILSDFAGENAELLVPMMAAYWGLVELLSTQWGELSEDQRHSVCLARMMCIESPLIIMDGIFEELDGQDKERVIKLIAVMCDNGSTIVVIHNEGQQLIPFSSIVYAADYNK